MTKQSNIQDALRSSGLYPRSLAYQLNRVATALSIGTVHRYLFIFQPASRLPAPMPQYAYSWHEVDDPELAVLYPDEAVRANRFRQGAGCLTISGQSGPAAAIWLAERRFDEDEVQARFLLASPLMWDFGLFVRPDLRHTRAFQALWGATALHLQQRGKAGTVSRIADYLAASLQPHARMGAHCLGAATFVKMGDMQLCISSLAGGWHLARSPQERAIFNFDAPISGQ